MPETQKKRKKNAPDCPQPPDEENPVLKPTGSKPTQEEERANALDFLPRRAVNAPMKSAPPALLLNLIATFLTEYGFHSTGRVFSTERVARNKIHGWDDPMMGKLEKG